MSVTTALNNRISGQNILNQLYKQFQMNELIDLTACPLSKKKIDGVCFIGWVSRYCERTWIEY